MTGARRVDHSAGIVEEAEFFGTGVARIFGIRYKPASSEPLAGVVMCDPILAQFRAHYRIGTLTARAMAARGLVVQRFHYRGMGNSDGDISDLDLASMTQDAQEAAARLVDQAGPVPVAYLGVNVGAYPAAVASRPAKPLILDSPPPNGRQYFRNALRAHSVYKLRHDSSEMLTADALSQELREPSADVSLLGCRLSLGLYESLAGTSLIEEIGDSPRPTLLLALGQSGVLRPEGERTRAELVERGFPVEVEIREKVDPFWYVENSAPEDQPDAAETATRIADWLERQVAGVMAGSTGDDA